MTRSAVLFEDPARGAHDAFIVVDAPPRTNLNYDRPTEEDPVCMIKFLEVGVFNLTFKVLDSDLEWTNMYAV